MTRLIAKSPLAGVLPVEVEGAVLREVAVDRMISVAPFKGKERAVSAALKEALGVGFPAPNRSAAKNGARIVWAGRGQAMLIGPKAPEALRGIAALTDQSDAWAVMQLEGPLAEATLARLVPLDLRSGVFKRGHTARSMLFHMTCSITRVAPQGFEIMVMRSMGQTAVHDLSGAMRSVAAQSGR